MSQQLSQLADYSSDAIAPNSMDIRTEYLEPITSSPLKYTFRLDQAGYLDTNSLLVFKLSANNNPNGYRVNAFNGVLGGIKRAIFQVGDHIINDIQDLNKYTTLKQVLAGNRSVSNQYTGHYVGSQLWTHVVGSAADGVVEGATLASNTTYQLLDNSVAGTIVVDQDKSGICYGGFADGAGVRINSQPLSNDKDANNQYGITLGTLFPALQGQKVPLFLFDKQRILITVEFHGASKYVNKFVAGTNINYGAGGANNGIALDADINVVDCRLVVDYIIMPTEAQNKIVAQTQQQGGYKLNFFDVVSVEKNIPAVAVNNTTQEVEHRIGQNNREVHNVYMWKEPPISALNNPNNGGANQSGQPLRCAQYCMGHSEEEYNVEVNGRDEWDHYVYNPCSQYNELSESLGADPNLDRVEYVGDEMTAGSLLGTTESGLMGTMKPLSLCLRNGEQGVIGAGRQIGSYPIVWKWKRRAHTGFGENSYINAQSIKVNYLIECSRTASIMSTPKGMNVMVSY